MKAHHRGRRGSGEWEEHPWGGSGSCSNPATKQVTGPGQRSPLCLSYTDLWKEEGWFYNSGFHMLFPGHQRIPRIASVTTEERAHQAQPPLRVCSAHNFTSTMPTAASASLRTPFLTTAFTLAVSAVLAHHTWFFPFNVLSQFAIT